MSGSYFLNTLILLGILQGFIVSSLLFFQKGNTQADRILGILILFIALASLNLYGEEQNWFGSAIIRLISYFIPLVMPMTFGPLIYFYVQSALTPDFKIAKKQRRHFLAVIIDLVPPVTILLFFVSVRLGIPANKASWGTFIDDYNVYADIPRWMSISFYTWLSAKYLKADNIRRRDSLKGQQANLKWLRQFIMAFTIFQAIWLLYLVPYVIPRYTDWMLNTISWYPVYIPIAVLIYWLGMKGYWVSRQQQGIRKKTPVNTEHLSSVDIDDVIASLKRLMDENKIFLDPDLNLAIMAKNTGITQRVISTVLNHHLKKSFTEFVNEYRVNAVQEKMTHEATNNLTITGIALECGFSSQATFQRVFKNSTGLTPKEFMLKRLQKDEKNAQIML